MRHELTENEWCSINPTLPNKSRGVPRVDDRRVLNCALFTSESTCSKLDRAR
jgi:transposase